MTPKEQLQAKARNLGIKVTARMTVAQLEQLVVDASTVRHASQMPAGNKRIRERRNPPTKFAPGQHHALYSPRDCRLMSSDDLVRRLTLHTAATATYNVLAIEARRRGLL